MIADIARGSGISEDAARQRIVEMLLGIPIGRPGRPEEVAELVAFLASDRGAFISGADYIVDAGRCPRLDAFVSRGGRLAPWACGCGTQSFLRLLPFDCDAGDAPRRFDQFKIASATRAWLLIGDSKCAERGAGNRSIDCRQSPLTKRSCRDVVIDGSAQSVQDIGKLGSIGHDFECPSFGGAQAPVCRA